MAYPIDRFDDVVLEVLLKRAPEQVIQSAWWAKNPEKSRVIVTVQQRMMSEFHARHPDNSFELDFEDVVTHSNKLRKLFEFLGAPYIDERLAEVDKSQAH